LRLRTIDYFQGRNAFIGMKNIAELLKYINNNKDKIGLANRLITKGEWSLCTNEIRNITVVIKRVL